MKKQLIGLLAVLMVVAVTAPCYADHFIGGYYRIRGIMASDFIDKDGDPAKVWDQRFRAKWTNNMNEYVTIVYYGEVDMQWGDTGSSGTRGDGGGLGGDAVNLETKNAYMSIKIPETPVAVTAGLQAYYDNGSRVYADGDGAGAKVDVNLDMVKLTGWYIKAFEGNTTQEWKDEDDRDLWMLQAGLAPIEGLKLDLGLAYENNNTVNDDLFWLNAVAGYTIDPITLEVTGVYNFGEVDGGDGDVSAFHLSALAKAKVAGASVHLRGFYFSGDQDDEDENHMHGIFGGAPPTFAATDGLMIGLADVGTTHVIYDANAIALAYTEEGLMGATIGGKYMLPMMKGAFVQLAAAYYNAVDEDDARDGSDLGFEIAGHAGVTVAEVVELSLNGATMFMGDYYNGTAGGDDPDNPYVTYLMVNIPW